MDQPHPINRSLLTLLENQVARTGAAFEDLDEPTFAAEPGADCNSIQRIGRHLLLLRRFQISMLESPLADEVDLPERDESLDGLRRTLDEAAGLLRHAIVDHDPDDWYTVPDPAREGRWGDEATLLRFVRPFNDFTNHLGAIRAIRRILGKPNERTQ